MGEIQIDGPTRCCLLGICCPPETRVKTLSAFLSEIAPGASSSDCDAMASALLAEFDLAPKGLSAFVLEKYGPAFAE